MYLHWSKKLAMGLLAGFAVLTVVFLAWGGAETVSALKVHTTRWIVLNYVGLLVWLFVWISDQTRMRGKQAWIWALPFILAPVPTLAIFLLHLQQRMR